MDQNILNGPTGETCLDLPSPYQAHRFGLLHLPRFIAKIKKYLNGDLPTSYQRNFTKGFDGFLCLHLGVDPEQIIECVKTSSSDSELDERLMKIFQKIRPHIWTKSCTNGYG